MMMVVIHSIYIFLILSLPPTTIITIMHYTFRSDRHYVFHSDICLYTLAVR